uniref:Uncharacterized protein n=1 Tax=Arundo donax TaxID=35708 RepID=A0A0A8Z2P7_ARUDO
MELCYVLLSVMNMFNLGFREHCFLFCQLSHSILYCTSQARRL